MKKGRPSWISEANLGSPATAHSPSLGKPMAPAPKPRRAPLGLIMTDFSEILVSLRVGILAFVLPGHVVLGKSLRLSEPSPSPSIKEDNDRISFIFV